MCKETDSTLAMSASHCYTDRRYESLLVGIKGCYEESLSTHCNCCEIDRTWQVIKANVHGYKIQDLGKSSTMY